VYQQNFLRIKKMANNNWLLKKNGGNYRPDKGRVEHKLQGGKGNST
jgi:hypothetical protein